MRIHVTGNSGSGKTTLARALGAALALPVHGLDRVVWRSGWRKTEPAERERLEAALIAAPDWIIEGVSLRILAAADLVIFLDTPRRLSLLRVARRNWRYLFRSRPELPDGCPEILLLRRQWLIIWRFPTRTRPWIVEALAARPDTGFTVRTPADLAPALAALGLPPTALHAA